MTIHPVRTNGLVLGVPQAFDYLEKMQNRIINFIVSHSAVKEEYFSDGQTVIDVGINVDENNNLCGDVDYENVKEKVSAITPVPGGVGSVTTAVLLKNLVSAAERRA